MSHHGAGACLPPWRALVRTLRRLETRCEIRGRHFAFCSRFRYLTCAICRITFRHDTEFQKPSAAAPMLMHDPPHPGAFIRRQCLEPLGLTVTEAAKGLAVSRNTLSLLLNGRLGISPEMAIRLSQAFGGSPESWLQQQMQYDLWRAWTNRKEIPVRQFVTA